MEELQASTWQEVLDRIKGLDEYRQSIVDESKFQYVSPLLFRGHRSAEWHLETTLERVGYPDCNVREYHRRLVAGQKEFESHTGGRWETPTPMKVFDILSSKPKSDFRDLINRFPELYPYMVQMRHHGLPSPLLDWTRSAFVAAYFAFQDAEVDKPVAIYCYCEWAGGSKGGYVGARRLEGIGPHIRTTKRHYMQQAEYTVALEGIGEDLKYCNHHAAMPKRHSEGSDKFWKITISGEVKREALLYLMRHNINAYTLFGSEDALAKSIGIREFILGKA